MASILITMITLIVISLIVLGFATIAHRQINNTTDQQLSSQAFYAAESAVNDARKVIGDAIVAGQPVPEKDNCKTNAPGGGAYPAVTPGQNGVMIDAAHNVSYTCLLVGSTPANLSYDGVSDSKSQVVQVKAANTATNITTITVSWTTASLPAGVTSPGADCPGSLSQTFSPAPSWKCGYGVLREDILPTSSGSLTNMASKTLTGFFEPQNSSNPGSALAYGAATIGKPNLLPAACNVGTYNGSVPSAPAADRGCMAKVTGLTCAVSPCNNFTLRLTSLYQISNVLVTAYDSAGNPVPTGGQVMVDATGNANGVLRRIQVRLPVNASNGTIPAYAIQSNGAVCKRFSVTPGYFSIGNIINPDTSNPLCNSGELDGNPQSGGF